MTFKSAYLKLTAFYVLIVMIISIFFSLILYRISSNEMNRSLRNQIQNLQEMSFFYGSNFDFEFMRLKQLAEANRRLKYYLIYFNLIIFAASSGLGYLLAKRTLKPIKEMMISQSRFTADASHELRTPLTALKTEIEVNLRDKNLNLDQAKKLLKSNLEEVSKLENLSNSLLKLAKYEEGKNIILEEVSLEDVIVESYLRVEKQASIKKIDFENKFENVKVKGDKSSLVELFVVLLENAIKYSPANSKIFITMTKTKSHVSVAIKDQGIGIKQSDLPYIFNRFYRSDLSRSKEKMSGYGLGLAIADKIVKIHNGKIIVKSQINQGSEFIVVLPKE